MEIRFCEGVKASVSSHTAARPDDSRPQESLRRIIATRFIGRNCCHKMVTKVVFTFGTRGVFIIRSKQSDLHDDYGGNLPLLLQFNCFRPHLSIFTRFFGSSISNL